MFPRAFVDRQICADYEMPASMEHRCTPRKAWRKFHIISVLGNACVPITLEAFEFLIQDEVHHARHSVRSVSCRSTTGHHVYALNEANRNQIRIKYVGLSVRDMALTINQNQRALSAQRIQIEIRLRSILGAARIGSGATIQIELGIVFYEIKYATRRLLLDFARRDSGNRRRCRKSGITTKQGAGNDHRFRPSSLSGFDRFVAHGRRTREVMPRWRHSEEAY